LNPARCSRSSSSNAMTGGGGRRSAMRHAKREQITSRQQEDGLLRQQCREGTALYRAALIGAGYYLKQKETAAHSGDRAAAATNKGDETTSPHMRNRIAESSPL